MFLATSAIDLGLESDGGVHFYSNKAQANSDVKYQVEFAWERVPDAKGYEVEFVNTSRSDSKQKMKTKKSFWSGGLVTGIYKMRIRSLDHRAVPGAWSEATELMVLPPDPQVIAPKRRVVSQQTEKSPIKFQWKAREGVSSYLLKINSQSSDFKYEKVVNSTSIEVELPIAQRYSWQVYSQVQGVADKLLSAKINQTLVIGRAQTPEIHAPTNEFIEGIEWKKNPNANKYTYLLYKKEEKGWRKVGKGRTKKQKIKISRRLPGGKYKLRLAATGKYRKRSVPAQVEFDMAAERGPAAVKRARLQEAVIRPSLLNATGSYVITNLSYAAANPEAATSNNFNALGGSGRVGLGYTPKGTNWGAMGFSEFSGFTIEGQVFTYFGLELHGTYRKNFGSHVMRTTGGLFIKELPETLSSFEDETQFDLQKIRFAGPHIGVDYSIPFSEKLGVQFNTRLYYSLLSMGTPNGEPVQGTLSYQLSLLGSYRINRKLTALIGYALKKDAVKYGAVASVNSDTSFADEGDINSVDLSGNYLHLMLEWGF